MTLHEYIKRFARQCTELPTATDVDVVGAFLAWTTCKDLVHELGCKGPRTTKLYHVLEPNSNLSEYTNLIGSNVENDAVWYWIFPCRFHP